MRSTAPRAGARPRAPRTRSRTRSACARRATRRRRARAARRSGSARRPCARRCAGPCGRDGKRPPTAAAGVRRPPSAGVRAPPPPGTARARPRRRCAPSIPPRHRVPRGSRRTVPRERTPRPDRHVRAPHAGASLSSGPRSSDVIGAGSRPQERGPPPPAGDGSARRTHRRPGSRGRRRGSTRASRRGPARRRRRTRPGRRRLPPTAALRAALRPRGSGSVTSFAPWRAATAAVSRPAVADRRSFLHPPPSSAVRSIPR